MLSKDLTANPKAVNIIRPLHQQQQQQHNIFSPQFQQQLNFSTSTNSSSCTFSTASTTTINTIHTSTTTSPMIRQPSAESNPGLSFFCQASPTNNHTILKSNINQHQKTLELKQQQQQQHQPQQPPLVISRINLSNFNRRPTITSDLDQSITEPVEEDEAEPEDEEEEDDDYDDLDMYVLDDLDEEEEPDEQPTPEITPNNSRIASTFKPGFGIMSGGLGSFLLRGTMAQPKPQVDEARVHRKVKRKIKKNKKNDG